MRMQNLLHTNFCFDVIQDFEDLILKKSMFYIPRIFEANHKFSL